MKSLNIIKTFNDFNIIFKNELVIAGPYPPPRGGIAVHIERLTFLIEKHNISYCILNHGTYSCNNIISDNNKYSWWSLFLLFTLVNRNRLKKNVFHFHLFTWYHYIYLLLFSIFTTKKMIITIHNNDFFGYNKLKKLITLKLLKLIKYKYLIAVSKKLTNFLLARDIRVRYLPAFLPPLKICKANLKSKKNNVFKIATNMWRFDKKQIRRYGIDLLFRLLEDFNEKIALYIFVSNKLNKNRKDEFIGSLDNEIKNQIKFLWGENLIDYLHNFDVFIRPNREDGFPLSILEALLSNVPVIASDTCIRPEGTILFTNENYKDLKNKFLSIYNRNKKIPTDIINKHNYGEELVSLYEKLRKS